MELLAGRQPLDADGDTGGQTTEQKPLLSCTWGTLGLTSCLVGANPRGLSTCGLPGPWSPRLTEALTGSSWAHGGFSGGAVTRNLGSHLADSTGRFTKTGSG